MARPTLDDVVKALPGDLVESLASAQQIALLRLLIFVTGEIHEQVNDVAKDVLKPLRDAPADEPLQNITAVQAQQALRRGWPVMIRGITDIISTGMVQAASIPFGVWAILHDELVLPVAEEALEERLNRRKRTGGRRWRVFHEQVEPQIDVFKPHLTLTLAQARDRYENDRLQLSSRIWRLDVANRRKIERTLVDGVANGRSAWQTARRLEPLLGAGRDCPRWTSTRLGKLTKRQIAAGVTTGLYSGDECESQGVAYNALRLARNEMQVVFNAATDANFNRMPWIDQEKIHLSPEHPEPDICDDVVNGGENGDGVYPKGEIDLPLHVQCLCWKAAVLMDNDLFVTRLRGWLDGTAAWEDMDSYARDVGGNVNVSLKNLQTGLALSDWLIAGVNVLETVFYG